jgi:hypothetical protein
MAYICYHHKNVLHKGNGSEQQRRRPNDGNDSGNDSSDVGKCGDGNRIYFAINLCMMVMAVAITAPTIEGVALQ